MLENSESTLVRSSKNSLKFASQVRKRSLEDTVVESLRQEDVSDGGWPKGLPEHQAILHRWLWVPNLQAARVRERDPHSAGHFSLSSTRSWLSRARQG